MIRKKDNASKLNNLVLSAVALMFAVATVHLISTVGASYYYSNLITQFLVSSGGQSQSFTSPSLTGRLYAMQAVQTVAFVVQLWLGDGFMVYLAFGIMLMYDATDDKLQTMSAIMAIKNAYAIIGSVALFATSFVVHLSCTAILESGAIYSLSILSVLISYTTLTGIDGYYMIIMNAVPPLIGITFSIIIVRMSLGVTAEIYVKEREKKVAMAGDTRGTTATPTLVFAQRPTLDDDNLEAKQGVQLQVFRTRDSLP
ncbi:hypothetical protein CONPUDRAFT_74441 [Coniophora puteana RWD-64-598 SS2]|uniref:Uncharacterized protein n=1 Tax=Coniophora puteana (strain RWD-64-598) TaxID=741705 RepID=A0A5M3MIU8_CONPW|nr:uncharacterized protein CONPUDRAFT_74441 [Coniophora puteana RWD-64-598 SS2]EIW78850.1 hypothetical protein CONPUDRAFT_74441 [Coniophora puteana RWD-64-598 SS2]